MNKIDFEDKLDWIIDSNLHKDLKKLRIKNLVEDFIREKTIDKKSKKWYTIIKLRDNSLLKGEIYNGN